MTHPDTLTIPRAVVEQALEAMEPFAGNASGIHKDWADERRRASLTQDKPLTVAHFRVLLKASEALRAALQPQAARCPLCNYDHGHSIGCNNNPVDIALKAHAATEPVIPSGFALVPIRVTPAMEEVFAEEGWEWANVLAAAEAVTEEEYEDAQAAAEPVAYCVYFPTEQRQEYCQDLDELCEDLTNLEHEITPLYTTPPATQAAPLNPDWSLLEATQESLREHQAIVASQQAALTAALGALTVAVRQNEHDMLMTGEELRKVADAIAQIEALVQLLWAHLT